MPEFKYDTANPGPCCQKISDMMKYARPIINKWPPLYKYTIGEEIMREMLNMLRLSTKARLKYMNKSTLGELDTSKEVCKAFIHQANETEFADKTGNTRRLLSDRSFGVWSEQLNEIGRLIGGWISSVNGRKSSDNGNVP